jgi:hypothetical protein
MELRNTSNGERNTFVPLVTIFSGYNNPRVVKSIKIDECFQMIGSFRPEIEEIRAVVKSEGKNSTKYKNFKKNYHCICWSVSNFKFNYRRKENAVALSGYIYFDIDNISFKQIESFKDVLKSAKEVQGAWKSTSNNGLGFISQVEGLSIENFDRVWSCLYDRYKEMGLPLDKSTKDIARLNSVSFDPDIFINTTTNPIRVDELSLDKKVSFSDHFALSNHGDQMEPSVEDLGQIFIKDLKFTSDSPQTNGKEFIVIPEGLPWLEAWISKEIKEGFRSSTLYALGAKLIFLNPMIQLPQIKHMLYVWNHQKCNPPLLNFEIERMAKQLWNRHISGGIKVSANRLRKIFFSPSSNLSRREKQQIASKEIGKLRTQMRWDQIVEAAKDFYNSDKIITQKNLAEYLGVALSTIKRYWKMDNLKGEIKKMNENMKENRKVQR